MRERESQVERDVADDIETDEFDVSESGFDVSDSGFDTSDSADTGFETGEAGREEESPGWLRSRLGTVATTRSLLVAFVLTVAGMVGFGAISDELTCPALKTADIPMRQRRQFVSVRGNIVCSSLFKHTVAEINERVLI